MPSCDGGTVLAEALSAVSGASPADPARAAGATGVPHDMDPIELVPGKMGGRSGRRSAASETLGLGIFRDFRAWPLAKYTGAGWSDARNATGESTGSYRLKRSGVGGRCSAGSCRWPLRLLPALRSWSGIRRVAPAGFAAALPGWSSIWPVQSAADGAEAAASPFRSAGSTSLGRDTRRRAGRSRQAARRHPRT